MTELEQLAAQLYKEGAPFGPSWDQLGDITRSIWLRWAQEKLFGDLA